MNYLASDHTPAAERCVAADDARLVWSVAAERSVRRMSASGLLC
jgi:hypothetical protein